MHEPLSTTTLSYINLRSTLARKEIAATLVLEIIGYNEGPQKLDMHCMATETKR